MRLYPTRKSPPQSAKEEEETAKGSQARLPSVADLVVRGQAEYQFGNFASAVALFTDAIKIEQGNSNLYVLRAAAWAKKGDVQKAVEDARISAQLDELKYQPRIVAPISSKWKWRKTLEVSPEVETFSSVSSLSKSRDDSDQTVIRHGTPRDEYYDDDEEEDEDDDDDDDEKHEKREEAYKSKRVTSGCGFVHILRRTVSGRRGRMSCCSSPRSRGSAAAKKGQDQVSLSREGERADDRKGDTNATPAENAVDDDDADDIFAMSRRRRSLSSLCSIPEEELLKEL